MVTFLIPIARSSRTMPMIAVDHQERIAVRQDLRIAAMSANSSVVASLVHALLTDRPARAAGEPPFLLSCASRSTNSISRNHCFTGLAGVPPYRAPAGTSPLTLLVAAICAPSPTVT